MLPPLILVRFRMLPPSSPPPDENSVLHGACFCCCPTVNTGHLSSTTGRFEDIQRFIYMFLERPTGMRCFVYNVSVLVVIMLSLMFTWLCSIPQMDSALQPYTSVIDLIMIVFFGCEYLLRIWSSGCRHKYSGLRGRIRFICKPLCLLDMLAVVSLVGCLLFPAVTPEKESPPVSNYRAANFIIIRGLRFFQIGRLFHLDRYATSWRILLSVFNEHLFELITTVYFAFVVLVIGSYLLWMAERSNPNLGSMADALYCTLITMSTIGYGDKVPVTSYGRVIVSTVGIVGVFLWALPAGIIGSGFALKVREERKKHRFNQLLPIAAALIQNRWRMKKSRNLYLIRTKTRFSSIDIKTRKSTSPKSVRTVCVLPTLIVGGQHSLGRRNHSENQLEPSSVLAYFINLIKYCVSRRKFNQAWRRHNNHIYTSTISFERNPQTNRPGNAYGLYPSVSSTTTLVKNLNANNAEIMAKLADLGNQISAGFAQIDQRISNLNNRINLVEQQ